MRALKQYLFWLLAPESFIIRYLDPLGTIGARRKSVAAFSALASCRALCREPSSALPRPATAFSVDTGARYHHQRASKDGHRHSRSYGLLVLACARVQSRHPRGTSGYRQGLRRPHKHEDTNYALVLRPKTGGIPETMLCRILISMWSFLGP